MNSYISSTSRRLGGLEDGEDEERSMRRNMQPRDDFEGRSSAFPRQSIILGIVSAILAVACVIMVKGFIISAPDFISTTMTRLSTAVGPSGASSLSGPSGDNIPVVVQPIIVVEEPIDFEMAREGYDPIELDHEYKKYKFLEMYDAVLEPYANMELVVSDMNSSLVYYRYDLCPANSQNPLDCDHGVLAPLSIPESSQSVNVSCAVYDQYSITVSEYDMTDTSKVLRVTQGTGICMYVRREIRYLTDADLEATLNAMYVLWELTQEEGQEIYGNEFNEAGVLLKFHHFNSAWQGKVVYLWHFCSLT
jgi:hypothetical protein